MSNTTKKFVDPDGTYTGGYTSQVLEPVFANHKSNQTRGVVQVMISSGSVDLQMRLSTEADWLTVKSYTSNAIEEVVLANYMRVVVSADATCWLGEVM